MKPSLLPTCKPLFQTSCRLPAAFFFRAIANIVRVQVSSRSCTYWNWLVFQEHCEHVLASSSVSQGAAALTRSPWLLPAKAAASADMFLGLLMTPSGHPAAKIVQRSTVSLESLCGAFWSYRGVLLDRY